MYFVLIYVCFPISSFDFYHRQYSMTMARLPSTRKPRYVLSVKLALLIPILTTAYFVVLCVTNPSLSVFYDFRCHCHRCQVLTVTLPIINELFGSADDS